jgi:hypothetical protein
MDAKAKNGVDLVLTRQVTQRRWPLVPGTCDFTICKMAAETFFCKFERVLLTIFNVIEPSDESQLGLLE